MKKLAVVYWSGTGNTEQMAKAVLAGAQQVGAEAQLFDLEQFTVQDMTAYDGFVFGCPAMGAEVLEEECFEPFFAAAEKRLQGVPVGLFGSYGWGNGVWMQEWETRTKSAGAKLVAPGLAIENTLDDVGIAACTVLGRAAAKALI